MNTGIIDDRILQDLVAEVNPQLDDRADDSFVRAAAAVARPHLERLAQAYREAARIPGVRGAAKAFLLNMLAAEDEL